MQNGRSLDMSNFRRDIIPNSSGAAAIEMAIVTPLFLLMALGILAYGVFFGAAHSTQQLAADAARATIAGLNPTERAALANEFIKDNAKHYPLLWPEKITVKAGPSPERADDFIVVVTFDATSLPIRDFAAFLPLTTDQIERTSVVRRGGMQ